MWCYSNHVLMMDYLGLKISSRGVLTDYVIYFFISIRTPHATYSRHTPKTIRNGTELLHLVLIEFTVL